jgi:hypothetical protein
MLSWAGILLFVPATRTLKLAGKNKSAGHKKEEIEHNGHTHLLAGSNL